MFRGLVERQTAQEQPIWGTPEEVPERYRDATPNLSTGPRAVAVVGSADVNVPPAFSDDPAQPGAIEVVGIDGADHFDLIDPAHASWATVVGLLRSRRRGG